MSQHSRRASRVLGTRQHRRIGRIGRIGRLAFSSALAAALTAAAAASPSTAAATAPVAPAPVSIQEWDVPTPNSRPHDPAVAPDGALWYTGQMANHLGRLRSEEHTSELQSHVN